jgi:ATP-dependent DNA helicase RecG
MVLSFIKQYGAASRKDIDNLLSDKLSDALLNDQKEHKIKNLIQSLRRDSLICNTGTNKAPLWVLAGQGVISKSITKKQG